MGCLRRLDMDSRLPAVSNSACSFSYIRSFLFTTAALESPAGEDGEDGFCFLDSFLPKLPISSDVGAVVKIPSFRISGRSNRTGSCGAGRAIALITNLAQPPIHVHSRPFKVYQNSLTRTPDCFASFCL